MMSDYRLKITVRNARILKAIEAMGYRSVSAFGREEGIRISSLCSIIGMKCSPVNRNGEFSALAKSLMAALCASPEELWSEDQLFQKVERNSFQADVDSQNMQLLIGRTRANPILELEHHLDTEKVAGELMDGLTKRQVMVIEGRLGMGGGGEKYLEQMAREFGVTRERIRQIEQGALRSIPYSMRKKEGGDRKLSEAKDMIAGEIE